VHEDDLCVFICTKSTGVVQECDRNTHSSSINVTKTITEAAAKALRNYTVTYLSPRHFLLLRAHSPKLQVKRKLPLNGGATSAADLIIIS
jgi:hypothetical protein